MTLERHLAFVRRASDWTPAQRAVRVREMLTLLRLSDRLSDLFETRVKVEQGRHKGKIIVEFATIDDLERIVKAMSPEAIRPESAD